eukprot:c13408_g1_i1.p1 GENE.c13408_g1_i1~~c13408_g1_i1.p1  ORF type:complete len:104 (-),score=20.71 c13408_g1_i1:308-619(-)
MQGNLRFHVSNAIGPGAIMFILYLALTKLFLVIPVMVTVLQHNYRHICALARSQHDNSADNMLEPASMNVLDPRGVGFQDRMRGTSSGLDFNNGSWGMERVRF